jgi:hypothetical protein
MSLDKKDQQQAYLTRITKNFELATENSTKAQEALNQAKALQIKAARELADYKKLVVNKQD